MRIHPSQSGSRPGRCRRGFGVVELAISVVMLASIAILVIQVVDASARQRVASGRRAYAIQLASNLMERVWESRRSGAANPLAPEPSRQDLERLPGLKWTATTAAEVGPPRSTRMTLELTWQRPDGTREAPVRLVAWFPEREGAKK